MKYRMAVMLVAALLMLVAVIYAQTTASPPFLPPPFLPGIRPEMTWGELASMIAVLGGISGGFQWLITRVIVQPQIERSIKAATKEIMSACLEQFTSKYAFGLHETSDNLNHRSLLESIQEIVEHQDTENQRLTDVRERVRVLEAFRNSLRRNET